MASVFHPYIRRNPETHRYELILPTSIPDDAVSSCSLSTVIRDVDPADDVKARRLAIEVRHTEDRVDLRVSLAPYLTPPAIHRLAASTGLERFWEYQGTLRHLLNPILLDNLVGVLRRALRPGARPLALSRYPDPPYRPNGPWEYLASQDPRDLAIRSRLVLQTADITLTSVPDVVRRLLRRSHYLAMNPPSTVVEYEPHQHTYSRFRSLERALNAGLTTTNEGIPRGSRNG